MEKDRAARKAAKAAKTGKEGKGGKEGGGEKKKNPVILEARAQFAKSLRDQGVAQAEIKNKVKAHIKDVVKPAMTAAKATATERKLKGPEKRKFIQSEVRAKLGLQAPAQSQ